MKKKLFIDILICIILGLCGFIYMKLDDQSLKPIFYLMGSEEIYIEVGRNYQEPGVIAALNGNNYSDSVNIWSDVNTDEIGDYTIQYTFNLLFMNKTLQRNVKVVDSITPSLSIDSEKEITIKKGESFQPAKATAYDNYDGDLTDKIVINNNVDSTKEGNYQVTYSVKDASNNIKTAIVTVHVIGKNPYIDISITNQTLTYYEYNEVVLKSEIVSGWNNRTPLGNYKVLYKSTNTILKGANFTSYVNYWIAFLGRSYGIHDALWRNKFGGEIYKTSGSHGCINMPLENAKKLYYLVEVGTPVYIHY